MSAVNPASVVNPNGQTQIQPPSAIGPGAILHTRTTNAPASVGGFGSNAFRATEQHGKCSFITSCRHETNFDSGSGRGRRNMAPVIDYDDGQYAFSQQLPQYPAAQNVYQAPQYGHQPMQTPVFDRYGYPTATASGSPMNFGGNFYPPTTYSTPPAFNAVTSGASHRGGYSATTANATTYSPAHGMVSAAGPAHGSYTTSRVDGTMYYNPAPTHNAYATSGADKYGGNSYTATSSAGAFTGYDPAYGMANLSFGN
jgi:hypothetical protein